MHEAAAFKLRFGLHDGVGALSDDLRRVIAIQQQRARGVNARPDIARPT